jgi:sulfur carrier protein
VVELNRNIVSRETHASTQLKEGDTLEIVHFVGGG